ncbi:MAG: hypothetical protein GEU83_19930 [Pseudonocardiaceae bacterium]|nr:hypothetical protein [Pseudonocardiaceae bacterium]
MRLERLAKDPSSGDDGCPGVELDLDSGELVITGRAIDDSEVSHVLPGEGVVRLKPEIVVEAMRRYRHADG